MKGLVLGLLLLALLLSACSTETVYTVEHKGLTFAVDTEQWTVTQGTDVYKVQYTQRGSDRTANITYPNGAIYFWSETGLISTGGGSAGYDPERYVSGNMLIEVPIFF